MKEDIEQHIAKLIKTEVDTASSNQSGDIADFEAVIDLLECKRTEKNYDWLSDVFFPEYPAILLTESSQWANQYFKARDFVEVYLENDEPDGQAKSALVKKLINKTLNRRELFHYQKYMRARTINSTAGVVYAVCGWDQELVATVTGYRRVVDENNPIQLPTGVTIPGLKNEEIIEDLPLKDCFEYDIIDSRNVFTDNSYCYSIQEKEWITIRSEESYEDLKMAEQSHGYFNLDKVKELLKSGAIQETATSKESYNKDAQQNKVGKPVVRVGDVYTRFGKMWAVVKDRDENNNPISIDYGYDDLGETKEKAELVEGISAIFSAGSNPILIRFQPTPFIDSYGRTYKPLLRGLCYVHPTKDTGMSDGKYARESQVALNDTINLSNDRVKLATLPTFVGDDYACEDNDQIFMEPEHVIPMKGGPENLKELQIKDNIQGAMQQAQMFISGMHKVTAVFDPTMGDMVAPSTPATTSVLANTQGSIRANYKSLTWEYTFLIDLYWMILQMSYRFMHPTTALKLLGEDGVQLFDPSCDYTYQPVSSAIEQEYSKEKKMSIIDQMMGRIVNIPNPNTPKMINKLMIKFFDLLGSEYQDIKDSLLEEGPVGQQAAMGMTAGTPDGGGMPVDMTSNQYGLPTESPELSARTL